MGCDENGNRERSTDAFYQTVDSFFVGMGSVSYGFECQYRGVLFLYCSTVLLLALILNP